MTHRNLVVCSLLLAALSAPVHRVVASARPVTGRAVSPARDTVCHSPAEWQKIGADDFNIVVAQVGRYNGPWLDNVDWLPAVDSIFKVLLSAAGQPGLQVTKAVVNDTTFQAYALAGGHHMIIHRGALDYAERFAGAREPTNLERRRARARGYVAALLGHELAHIIRGHTTTRCQIFNEPAVQPQEFEADRYGAWYTLRAHGEIQTAMDLWRDVDSASRASQGQFAGFAYNPAFSTYVSDHPRDATREAHLEIFRAKLKIDQSDFDDAYVAVSGNESAYLDDAIRGLDTVLVDFPDLLEAKHLRATAFELKWLDALPIEALQVRPSLWGYTTYFLPTIRATVVLNSPAMRQAKQGFEEVLSQVDQPAATISNAALLDAYAGNPDTAESRALRAVGRAQPGENAFVQNNLGVVYFLRGKYALARQSFETARQALPGYAAFTFNLGRTLKMLRDPQWKDMLNQYLTMDTPPTSAWRREAQCLLVDCKAPTAAPRPKPEPGSPPKLCWGCAPVNLDSLLKSLGRADTTLQAAHNAVTYVYGSRGIRVRVGSDSHVNGIRFLSPAAGDLGGVRVGDDSATARKRWGVPQDGDPERGAWFYDGGEWHVVITTDPTTGAIQSISASPSWP
jgi:tetratricopeptide (TPR) repeat protein